MATKWVFIAVSIAAVVLLSTTWVFVEGLPVLGLDLDSCKIVIPGGPTVTEVTEDDYVDCCLLGTDKPIKDFKFDLDLPMRVRRPAHMVDDEFVRKYERAVELMKALPPEDPRSFVAQSNIHCSYCSQAYNQFNSSVIFSAHNGWFFFPFHRWYQYFHERILASLIGDDTFAVPYWAWDVQGGSNPPANIMPPIFTRDSNSSLYDELRTKSRQSLRVDLEYHWSREPDDQDLLVQANSYSMWRTMIGDVKTAEAFHGGKVVQGDQDYIKEGVFETGPHASVHRWVGDETDKMKQDMTPSFSSARDPLFYAHHSQVDRLWLMWKSWGGKDYDDPDWFNSEFLFYDENADVVRVNVRDSLNLENLRITYDLVEADWVNFIPTSIRDKDPKYRKAGILRRIWRQLVGGETYRTIAIALGGYLRLEKYGVKVSLGEVKRAMGTWQVSRPELLRSSDDSSLYDEILVITGVVERPFDVDVLVHIFLELPEADENTPRHCVEFLGTLQAVSDGGLDMGTVALEFTKTIGIGDRLKILEIIPQKSVTVTFVPVWDPKHDSEVSVRVTKLKVEMKLAR